MFTSIGPNADDKRIMLDQNDVLIPNVYMFTHDRHSTYWGGLDVHSHDSCVEIHVLLEGRQLYRIGDKSYNLLGGDAIINYPDEIHGLGNDRWGTCDMLWILMDLSQREGFLGLSGDSATRLYELITGRHARHVVVGHQAAKMFHDAFYLFMKGGADNRLLGHSLLLTFLTRCFTASNDERTISSATQRALDYIRDNLSEQITLNRIADAACLSEAHLKEKFRNEIGVNIHHYILLQLVDKAERMLRDTDMTIADISASLGFSASSYFSTAFKKETGFTPRAYRMQYRANVTPTYGKTEGAPSIIDPRVTIYPSF